MTPELSRQMAEDANNAVMGLRFAIDAFLESLDKNRRQILENHEPDCPERLGAEVYLAEQQDAIDQGVAWIEAQDSMLTPERRTVVMIARLQYIRNVMDRAVSNIGRLLEER